MGAVKSIPKAMVSILLCTRDRAESLDQTLLSMAEIDVPEGLALELVLVDNGSTDGTSKVVRHHIDRLPFPMRDVVEPTKGKSRALNRGIQVAKGEIILFTDDDVRFPSDWIERMVRPILAGEADIVQGGVRWSPALLKLIPPGSYVPRMLASTPDQSRSELEAGLIGANMAICREAVVRAGLFDEALGPGALGLGEETLLAYRLARLGYRKVLALDVEVEHHFDSNRLTRSAVLAMAESKGRSLGYIEYHWSHAPVPTGPWRELALRGKLWARKLIGKWLGDSPPLPPEWEFSYRAGLARLRQLGREGNSPRRYPIEG